MKEAKTNHVGMRVDAGAPLVPRIKSETRSKIDTLAWAKGVSRSEIMNEALERYIAENGELLAKAEKLKEALRAELGKAAK